MRATLTGLLAGLSLGACATSGGDGAATSAQTSPSTMAMTGPTALSVLPESGLGPQSLEAGTCGLFLWSQTDVSKFIFFSEAASGQATMAMPGGPKTLIQTAAGGDIFGQFTTELGYDSPSGEQIDLRLVPGDVLDGGQRLESGVLTVTDQAGWQTKLPVLGVRACQPADDGAVANS
ncbi:MAG: hypothetical protein AAGF20_13210 [Pseudomonadota bacterium]